MRSSGVPNQIGRWWRKLGLTDNASRTNEFKDNDDYLMKVQTSMPKSNEQW